MGNLVSRIMKLAETYIEPITTELAFHKGLVGVMDSFEIQKSANHIWEEIANLDKEIQDKKPWESKDQNVIENLVNKLAHIGYSLAPFMPETSEKILIAIKNNKLEAGLFPRKD